MQIVNWKSELYSVNVDEIDQQHQHLFHLLNKLFDSMSKGSDKEVLREVLTELMDYTHYHFGCEEAHFCELSRYKCKEKHKEEHQEFVEHIQSFYNDALTSSPRHLFRGGRFWGVDSSTLPQSEVLHALPVRFKSRNALPRLHVSFRSSTTAKLT